MAMSRKDYTLIANAIVAAKLAFPINRREANGIRLVEANIVQALARECPGFNVETFRAACTIKEG